MMDMSSPLDFPEEDTASALATLNHTTDVRTIQGLHIGVRIRNSEVLLHHVSYNLYPVPDKAFITEA